MKTLYTICSLLCFTCTLHAIDITFSQISSSNGLSQNTVKTIVEDKNGFIWAGTLDGLNRYDGYNIRSYQPQLGNPNALDDHRVKDLYVDRDGYVWVQTYRNDISCFDPVSDSFIHVRDKEEGHLTYVSYHESSRGDMWFWGKYDGVIRIRKNNMPALDIEKFLPKSSRGEGCNFLFEDSDATIWVGGEMGLYTITGDSITAVDYPGKQKYVFTQAAELNGKLYFSTQESSLVVLDKASRQIDVITYAEDAPFTNILYLSEKKLLVVAKTMDVLLFDTETSTFEVSAVNNDPDFSTFRRGALRTYVDQWKRVWLFNSTGVIWYYSPEADQFEKVQLDIKEITENTGIDQLYVDSKGIAWVVTYGYGLFSYDIPNRVLTNYSCESLPNSLPSDYLLDIVEDRFGGIWLGSEYAGIIRVVKTPDYFRIVRPELNTVIGKTNNVRAICEDSRGNFWIGAKNGGLYLYDSALSKGKSLAENTNIYSVVEDDKQRMWVGSKINGIYVYDVKTQQILHHFRHHAEDPASLSNDIIFHVMKDNKGRIWAGSFAGGVTLIEEKNNRFTFHRFIQDEEERSYVRYLFQDSKGRIWAGSNGGLMRFDPEELMANPKAYTLYEKCAGNEQSISSNDIKIIYEDKSHTIWIGTAGGGLNKYVEATADTPEHFISYSARHGLGDNYVLGILEYESDLWISSENGLTRFSKDGESIVSYQFAQKAFGNIFNEGAFWQTGNGDMLWGTLDGLLIFKPDQFRPDTCFNPVLFTQLTIDRTDWNDLKHTIYDKSITYSDKIDLTYKQNNITLEFATMNLRNPAEKRYSYMLENYDKDWSFPSYINTATYKNLPHGKYTFKVKGVNPSGVLDAEATTLRINIAPPFWLSWQAYILYVLLAGLLLYVAFHLILKFNRMNNAVEVEKQLTNHKLRFFTNISHEFRTPLTLIQGAVESLSERADMPASTGKQLNIMSRNVGNLRRLIDQLLEFRKLQNNIQRLDLEEVNIVGFARDIYTGFLEVAERKNIDYTFTSSIESLLIHIDQRKVDKILYNLLSNAFKFTPKDGSIELALAYDEAGQTCHISVKDSGVGIPKEKQHLLFSRFTQINFSNSGTGVGLSLVKEFIDVHKGKISYESNPDGGSIFKIELPTSKDTYKGENFITSVPKEIMPEEGSAPATSIPVEADTHIDSRALADYQLLIIDDNDDIRSFLTEEFCKYLHVETAADGKEGLQKAIDMNPDLIICDVMMPEMDGFEVTRQLKNEFQTCHIPIILLTAHSSIEHQLEGIDSGADAYITKPFSLKYIVKRVMKLIEQRELLKKRFSKEVALDVSIMKNSTDKDKQFLERIEKILEDNYPDSNFTLDRFVELAGMRRTIFFKKVKGVTGFPPNELLKMKRLNKSALLLKDSELTISEISYKVGFEDPFYFSKCFKIHFNCTPSQYKSGKESVSAITFPD